LDEKKFLAVAAQRRWKACDVSYAAAFAREAHLSRRSFITGTLASGGVFAFPTKVGSGLQVVRDGRRIRIELNGSAWLIDPDLFGGSAWLSLSSAANHHVLRLRDAKLAGTTLDVRLSAAIYQKDARWRVRLRVPALRIDSDLALAEWLRGHTRVQGRPTTLAVRFAGDARFVSPHGATRYSMGVDWSFEAIPVRGQQRLIANGIDFPVGRLRMRPALKLDSASIAPIADGGGKAGPTTRIEGELQNSSAFELGSTANGSSVSLQWNPATELALECWSAMPDPRAILLLTGGGLVRIASRDQDAEPVQLPLDDGAMAVDFGAQRDALVAATLPRSSFGVNVGHVVLTLAARDDQPHLLRFRDGRTGHFEFKAELLEAHVPVVDADRGSIEFSAVPIDITDRPSGADSPAMASLSNQEDARVVLVAAPTAPECTAEQVDAARGLLIVGNNDRMFVAPLDKGRLHVHRSLDLFNLEFGFCNYRIRVIKGQAWLEPYLARTPCEPQTQVHRLIVKFPPQNVAEQAFQYQAHCIPPTGGEQCVPTEPPTPPTSEIAEARLSEPSRLVFEISPDSADAKSKRLSVEMLTEWSNMALAVNKRAMAADMSIDDQLNAIGIKTNTDRANALLKIIQYVTPPGPDETAIEPVFRLQISPAGRSKFTTPHFPPQRSAGEKWKSDALLWHARIDPTTGGDTMRVLWSRDDDLAWIFDPNKPPIWENNVRPWDSDTSPFYLSLTERQRAQLVLLTSIPGLPALRRLKRDSDGNVSDDPSVNKQGDPLGRVRAPKSNFAYLHYDLDEGVFSPKPFSATLFMTSLGGSLDSYFEIEPPATAKPAPGELRPPWRTASVQLWQHKARLGRDMYVKILEKGFALPHGHRTAYVSLTERKFARRRDSSGNPTNEIAAFLFQRHFTISTPTKAFPAYGQPYNGLDFPAMKFVTLTTPTSPDLAPPQSVLSPGEGKAFWLRTDTGQGRVGSVIFEWTIDDDKAPVKAPMMFVDNQVAHTADSMKKVVEIYRDTVKTDLELRRADHGGTPRRYAEFTREGDTVYNTADWLLSVRGRMLPGDDGKLVESFVMDGFMEGEDQPPFYPVVENAHVTIQSLDRLLGKPQGPVKVRFNQTYVENGFDHGKNPSEIYFDVISPEINLNVSSDGTSSGGVAKPNTRVAAISRANGLIGGRVLPGGMTGAHAFAISSSSPPGASSEPAAADFTSAMSGRFDPIEYFGGAVAEAKLLGIVPLKDVVRVVAMAAAPKLSETVAHGAGDAADKILEETRKAIKRIRDTAVPAITDVEDAATNKFKELNLGDDWRALYPDLGARLSDLAAELERAVAVANAATGTAGVAQVINEASRIVEAVKALIAEIARIARNPVPPLIGAYLKTLQEQAQQLRDLAKDRLDGVVKFIRAEVDAAIREFCDTVGTTEAARLLFGDNGPAACAALLSDPKDALPYLQGSLLYEVFGSYLWQFLDTIKRLEGAATDFIVQVDDLKAQIVTTVRREADAALTKIIDSAADAAAEKAVQAITQYTELDAAARGDIKRAAVSAAKWISAPGLEVAIGKTIDDALPKAGQNKTVDSVAAAIRGILPRTLADITAAWRANLADKVKTLVESKLAEPDLGKAIASIPPAVATLLSTELSGANTKLIKVVNDSVGTALRRARGAVRGAVVDEATKVVDAVASSLSLPEAKHQAFKNAVIERIDHVLAGGVENGLDKPASGAGKVAGADLTALAAELKKVVEQQLSAYGADAKNKAIAALTGTLNARLKEAIADAKADLTSRLTALVNSAFDALLASRQLKDLYDIRDKIDVAGQKWCGTAVGEISQISEFIRDVSDQAIGDVGEIQKHAQDIRSQARKFTLPSGGPVQLESLRTVLDRTRAATLQTLDRLDIILNDLTAARLKLRQTDWTKLDCSKLGPALELSGRIFDLRRRAVLEIRNLTQHLVDGSDLVTRIGAAPSLAAITPIDDLKAAVRAIGDALRGLIRDVTSIGKLEAPAGTTLWGRIKTKVDAIKNGLSDGAHKRLEKYAADLDAAFQRLQAVGLDLQARARKTDLSPQQILDLVREVSGFTVDDERRLAGLILQIVVADNDLAGKIAARVDKILTALGTVLYPIHETADTAVIAVLDMLKTPPPTFVVGRKAIFAAEAYVLGLFQLYPTVYLHKATRGAEKIFTELLARAITLIKNGSADRTRLPPNHPLVKFAKEPDNIECALALDDTVVWGALALMAESPDDCIARLATRMRDRKLYKCLDVRAKIAHDRSDKDAVSPQADEVCAGIRDEVVNCRDDWAAKSPDAPPRILFDEAIRSPYNELTEDKGPLNQINIRTEGDHLVDLSKRSIIVSELQTYKAFRVYYVDGDEEAKAKMIEIMDSGISKWPA
jgi:hypothetical protein